MIAAIWLFACDSSEIVVSDKCTVEIEQISPTPLIAGQQATMTAKPMSEPWDSRISIGQSSVLAASLERIGCEECDSCRARYNCLDCFDCDSCDVLCQDTCSEQLTFQVPNALEGDFQLYLVNRFGQSQPLSISVYPQPFDTGFQDSGLQ